MESEPFLPPPARPPASAVVPASASTGDITGAPLPHWQQQQQARREAGEGDEEEVGVGSNPTRPPRPRRRWKGHLLFPCGGTSYESFGVFSVVACCFPCPLLWPCVFSHSHGRLLSPLRAARPLTFALFFLFVFVPWVVLRVPLAVARAQACAPLTDTGGRGIPHADVVECLRLIKIDDIVFWVSVGLTAAALIAAGALRFAVRRRLGVEGGCCCCGGEGRGRGGRSAAATTTKGAKGSPSSPSHSLGSVLAAASWFVADVLTWLLCPACALCQEARSAAAWERERRRQQRGDEEEEANGGGRGGRGNDEEEEGEEPLLPLEAPAVPRAFDRGGGGRGGGGGV